MPEFGQFVHDSWNWLAVTLATIVGISHLNQNRKIDGLSKSKLGLRAFETEKTLLVEQCKTAKYPIEKKIDKIETYLVLLMKNQGIDFHE